VHPALCKARQALRHWPGTRDSTEVTALIAAGLATDGASHYMPATQAATQPAPEAFPTDPGSAFRACAPSALRCALGSYHLPLRPCGRLKPRLPQRAADTDTEVRDFRRLRRIAFACGGLGRALLRTLAARLAKRPHRLLSIRAAEVWGETPRRLASPGRGKPGLTEGGIAALFC